MSRTFLLLPLLAYLICTATDSAYEYPPPRQILLSLSSLLSLHQPPPDESPTTWANRVCAVRKVWLEVFAISTLPRVPHVRPTRYASSQKAQDDRNEKGDTSLSLFRGYRLDRFSPIFQVIGTHNGTFHCDEALAVYMLRQTSTYADAGLPRRLRSTPPPLTPMLGRVDPNERSGNVEHL